MAIYKTLVKKVSIPPDKKTKQKQYEVEGKLAIVDQGHKLIGGYSNDQTLKLECSLPVIVFGDHTCAVKYIDFPFGAGADGIKVLEPSELIKPKYLYYGTQYLTLRFPDKGYARHYQHIEKMDLTVPPLPEQERIVTRIEELFSELDKAVETLQITKQQLAVYRQAVLKEAFEGCKMVKTNAVCEHITDGDHMPPPKAESGIPFIMISNIKGNKICWDNTNYVNSEYYNAIGEKRAPRKGDVLYTVTGSYGIPVKVDFDKDFCFQRHIALLRPNKKISQNYLFYAMQSPDVYLQATKRATGTAQKTVGLSVLRDLSIPFFESIEKQKEVTVLIESRLSVCESIEQTVDTALAQAEAMRQSILKQAFEGGL